MTQRSAVAFGVAVVLASVASAQTAKLSKEEKEVERFKAGCLGTAEWAKKLGVKADDGEACAKLARALQQGRGIEKSADLAEDYGRKACDKGAADGCLLVGVLRGDAFLGRSRPEDAAAMAASLQRGCDLGSGEACYELGFRGFQHGYGVPKDPVREVELYKQGCELKFASACLAAADMYSSTHGSRTLPPDDAAELTFWQRGCDLNEAQSCFRLAAAYKHGEGVPKDAKRKKELAAKACKLGEKNACGQW